jgi:hypothetical protein
MQIAEATGRKRHVQNKALRQEVVKGAIKTSSRRRMM